MLPIILVGTTLTKILNMVRQYNLGSRYTNKKLWGASTNFVVPLPLGSMKWNVMHGNT
jgi:hypothetical protein